MELDAITRKIKELESQVAFLKALQENLKDESYRHLLADVLTEKEAPQKSENAKSAGKPGVFGQVQAYFEGRANDWATFREIESACGLQMASIRQVVYAQFPKEFDRMSCSGGGYPTKLRMKVGKKALRITVDSSGSEVKRSET